jgi:acetyl-CoA C-acetyltransferase
VTQVKEQGACIARNALHRRRLARGRDRRDAQPLLRLGPGGGQFHRRQDRRRLQDAGIGGGVESMSRVPMGSDGGDDRRPQREALRKRVFMVPQGISADLIATREGITRDDVDRFALASQHKAARAIEEGASRARCSRSSTMTARSRSTGRAPARRHHARWSLAASWSRRSR